MKNKVPKLRFPEFSDEWEEKKLGDISSNVMYGMNAAATEFDGQNKYIRITDISEANNKFIPNPLSSPLANLEDRFLVNENDILFARTGASTGKSYLYDSKDGILYYAGFLIRFNINEENNSKYIFYQTLTKKYQNWLKIMSMRSGQPGINAEEYKEFEMDVPSLPEQEKIASFLSEVDKSIEILEEEKELWEKYKKGMMQKIFSQKLRFKDENGNDYPEWEEKKLERKVNFIASGKSKIKVENGKYNLYGSTGPIGFVDTIDYEGKYILVARVGANAGTVYKVDDKCGISDNTLVIECKEDVNYIFLYNKIKHYNLNKLIFGSGQPLITGGQLKDLKFCFPSLSEQEKIANFFSTIDEKIELIEEELELVKELKKGFLQKMFV